VPSVVKVVPPGPAMTFALERLQGANARGWRSSSRPTPKMARSLFVAGLFRELEFEVRPVELKVQRRIASALALLGVSLCR
jgi:hypothetical protein